MVQYRRAYIPGAKWFFTLILAKRQNNRLLTDNIDLLRSAFAYVKKRKPFNIDAIVILPEHLHCIWTLPSEDCDFSTRWSLLKANFSRSIENNEKISTSRLKKRERGIWQRRFWEHVIRNENDFNRHVDYIHYNPVKHDLVHKTIDWPYSSFHQFVKMGIYPENWGSRMQCDFYAGE
jgi:putative transposase